MSTIDKYNAPPGCIAVTPGQFVDGAGSCTGCCYDSGSDNGCLLDMTSSVMYSPCWAEGREDGKDVIFKKHVEEDGQSPRPLGRGLNSKGEWLG